MQDKVYFNLRKFVRTIDKKVDIAIEVFPSFNFRSDIGDLVCSLIDHNVTRLSIKGNWYSLAKK